MLGERDGTAESIRVMEGPELTDGPCDGADDETAGGGLGSELTLTEGPCDGAVESSSSPTVGEGAAEGAWESAGLGCTDIVGLLDGVELGVAVGDLVDVGIDDSVGEEEGPMDTLG